MYFQEKPMKYTHHLKTSPALLSTSAKTQRVIENRAASFKQDVRNVKREKKNMCIL
jgi:hypothetical protein